MAMPYIPQLIMITAPEVWEYHPHLTEEELGLNNFPKAIQPSGKPGLSPGSGQVQLLGFTSYTLCLCQRQAPPVCHSLTGFSCFKKGSSEDCFIELTELGLKAHGINDARRQIPASGGTEPPGRSFRHSNKHVTISFVPLKPHNNTGFAILKQTVLWNL